MPTLDIIDIAWGGPDGGRAAGRLFAAVQIVGRRLGASRMRLSIATKLTAEIQCQIPG